MAPISKSASIAIVGGGAFGLSTALHLVQNNYTDITIVRAEYEDPFYTDLTVEAIAAWKTSLFAPHFHQTGFLHCASGAAPQKAIDTLRRFQNAAKSHPAIAPHVLALNGPGDIRPWFWQCDGPLPGWKAYMNRCDGYAHSGNALAAIYRVMQASGVNFFLGAQQGGVREIVYENGKSVGVRTLDGKLHASELVMVAAGAGVGKILPTLGMQIVAKSWPVAHVLLSDEETSALRGSPVTYARDLGFFFEPDPKTNLLKLCPMGGGYINTDKTTGVSHSPFPGNLEASSGFLPAEDESRIRKLLQQTLPALSDRPLVRKSLCWLADTKDGDSIIDFVPVSEGSVVILSGDSGHGFKMFPIVGKWRWRWKPEEEKRGDWGGDVSWRLGESRELRDVLPGRVKL
ncbi:FAD dependent oxidoreductase [Aspergillus desertorum]